ncbi:MAG: EamA family transporter [Firmicutes bacterium]|nr:EamA family transporter [Bacillota bacterium]
MGVTLNYISYFEAIAWTSATTAVILLYTAPIFVTVAASVLFEERFTRNKGPFLAAYALYQRRLAMSKPAMPTSSVWLSLLPRQSWPM